MRPPALPPNCFPHPPNLNPNSKSPTPAAEAAAPSARYGVGMGKGYAEGPAVEEALANVERLKEGPAKKKRKAVFGSTPRKHERHFIGWADEVDPDELFPSAHAWGLPASRLVAAAADRLSSARN